MRSIKIERKIVGEGKPCFIIAEAGLNHNGNFDLAKKMVEKAAAIGADAIKFQSYRTEKLVSPKDPFFEWRKKLELSDEQHYELADLAKDNGITFLSTVFDEEGVEFLEKIGISAFKIASGDLTHLPLLEHVAKKKKPIILSTGTGTVGEIQEAIDAIKKVGNNKIILLHCVSNYPASPKEINLRAIEFMRNVFNTHIGYSDHALGISIPLAAVVLGAVAIEKHFTLNKKLKGPDQKLSADPEDFGTMIKKIRKIEISLGSYSKNPPESKTAILNIRRSIAAKEEIPSGTVITRDMLTFLRPAIGIPPKFLDVVIGRKSKVDIQMGEAITWDKI